MSKKIFITICFIFVTNVAVIAYDKSAEYEARLSHYKPPMFSEHVEGNPHLETKSPKILRFEVQIQNADQLKRELKSLHLSQNLSFENIFSLDISDFGVKWEKDTIPDFRYRRVFYNNKN